MSLFSKSRSLPMPAAGDLIPARPNTRAGTVTVTNETALRHSAVWACLRLRADLISTMPIDVYRRVSGQQIEVPPPPVLRKPSGERVDMLEWMYSTQFDLDRAGNAFGIITERNGRGLPARIDLVPLAEVSVVVRKGELEFYRICGQKYEPELIWHEKQFTVAGLPVGLSPTAHAAWSIGEYQSIQQFALDWFGSGAIPAAHLKNTAKTVKSGEAETIKARFKAAVEGRDLLVTGADWEYKMIQAEQAASEWIEAKKFGIGDIARFYGCPGDLIDAAVATGSITYANITQRNLQFLIMNLGPAIIRREGRLTTLTPQPQYVKLNTDALLRMDPKSRAEMFKLQVDSRQRAVSEVRDLENLPPYTDAQLAEFDRLFGPPRPATPVGAQPKPSAEGGEAESATRHLPGKHDQSTHGRKKGSGEYSAGVDMIGEGSGGQVARDIDKEAAGKSHASPDGTGRQGPDGDQQLVAIAGRQGFDGKPKSVSKSEMDTLVGEKGHLELHRGVAETKSGMSASQVNAKFRGGDYYGGSGYFGNGTYAGPNKQRSQDFYSDGTRGSMMRMAARPEARIVTHSDLSREHSTYLARQPKGSAQHSVYSDPGRYAAARGYDIIHVHRGGFSDEYVILNRTSVITQKA